MNDHIKLLVVDDHDIVRAGLINLLEQEPDILIIGEAGDGLEAVKKTVELKPDVILMDIFMPHCNGLEATIKIHNMYPDIKVIILTFSEGEEYLLQVLKFGAAGYLVKNSSIGEIATAVRMAYTGEIALSPKMATRLVTELRKKSQDPVLSPREKEILRLLGEGLTNNAIANQLYIGESTVRTYLNRLLYKLNLKNRAEAIAYSARNYLSSKPSKF